MKSFPNQKCEIITNFLLFQNMTRIVYQCTWPSCLKSTNSLDTIMGHIRNEHITWVHRLLSLSKQTPLRVGRTLPKHLRNPYTLSASSFYLSLRPRLENTRPKKVQRMVSFILRPYYERIKVGKKICQWMMRNILLGVENSFAIRKIDHFIFPMIWIARMFFLLVNWNSNDVSK